MNSTDDLVEALQEDGFDPSESALAWLDAKISELAEVLVDYYLSSGNETPKDRAVLTGSRPTVKIPDKRSSFRNP
jgi:hypothetical protein